MKPNTRNSLTVVASLLMLLALPRNAFSATHHVTACGTVITTSGLWLVDNDLTCTGDAIDIQANNVTLKLQGHILTGPGYSGLPGGPNGVLAATASGAFVKMATVLGPGTITNFNNGIAFAGTSGGGVVGVTLTGNGFAGFVAGNDANNVAPTGLLISQNLITNNYGNGIEGAPITNTTIIGNTITGEVAHDGIALFFNSTNNQILGNTSSNNKQDGIDLQPGVSGNTIKGNQTNSNGDNGVAIAATRTHFMGNVSFSNGSNGGPLFDFVDQNANCVTDTYSNDVFGTSNQTCVK